MMSRIPVPHRSAFARAVSTALCVALAGTTVITSAPASATPLPLLRLAPQEAPASVLGLDGKDNNANNTLTNALRKAFANRGLSGGEEISLEEMRLTMGCSNDELACLSEGGKTLGVRRLVYGYLKPTGGGNYQLDIQILDVDTGQIEAQATTTLSKSDLGADKVDAKATAIVNQLMPAEDVGSDLPPRPDPLPETDTTTEVEPQEEPPPPKERGLYFGLEKPTPRWKWAGFATSLTLGVLAGGAAIGTGVWLKAEEGGFREELIGAAEESLTDFQVDKDTGEVINDENGNPRLNTINDVDPNLPEGIDLCKYARERPEDDNGIPLGMPGQVRNSNVVRVCNKGDRVRAANAATIAGAAVFGAMTLVFTGLLLIHKRKPAASAMLRHGVSLGVGPDVNGGVSFGGGLRF
jgi:hypothetical protein